MTALQGVELVLGVTGSIAAYKAVYLLRELVRRGAGVTCVLTASGTRFVGPLTFRTLSRRPVLTSLFEGGDAGEVAVEHVSLAERAQLIVVAPATANLLAKAAAGIADDALTTLLLAARSPVLVAPAMDGGMWEHPAVQANVALLKERGYHFVGPGRGELASGLPGPGRLAEPGEIVEAVERLLWPKRDLVGENILITAGPTREPLDPVRYLSNRSSGKMGYALGLVALRRGAAVTLVSGPTHLAPPAGARMVPVSTAEEMREAVLAHLPQVGVVIAAAAVADYRPKARAAQKIKSSREGLTLTLEATVDIISEVGRLNGERILVGFSAETHDLIPNARAKLQAKNLDLMVANDVSRADIGFEAEANQVVLLDPEGGVEELPRVSKEACADAILDRVVALRARKAPAGRRH